MSSKLSWLFICCIFTLCSAVRELQLVHVITSNMYYEPELIKSNGEEVKNYANVFSSSQLNNEYLSLKTNNMPNSLKRKIYDLGQYLREKYNEFLGDIYTEDKWVMHTTEYPVSMMAGPLINAGVWPPAGVQKWAKNFNWQPITTEYIGIDEDTLLLGILCPSFENETMKLFNESMISNSTSKFVLLKNYLDKNSNVKIQNPFEVATLYEVLNSMERNNQPLPKWSNDIYPDGTLRTVTLEVYDLLSMTKLQKQLNGGSLLKKIINDYTIYNHEKGKKNNKTIVYTGDDKNVAAILKNLNLWSPHIPEITSSVLMEMYFNTDTNTSEVKIDYLLAVSEEIVPLTVPGCDRYCPIAKFSQLINDVLPEDEKKLCRQVIVEDVKDTKNIVNVVDNNDRGKVNDTKGTENSARQTGSLFTSTVIIGCVLLISNIIN